MLRYDVEFTIHVAFSQADFEACVRAEYDPEEVAEWDSEDWEAAALDYAIDLREDGDWIDSDSTISIREV